MTYASQISLFRQNPCNCQNLESLTDAINPVEQPPMFDKQEPPKRWPQIFLRESKNYFKAFTSPSPDVAVTIFNAQGEKVGSANWECQNFCVRGGFKKFRSVRF